MYLIGLDLLTRHELHSIPHIEFFSTSLRYTDWCSRVNSRRVKIKIKIKTLTLLSKEAMKRKESVNLEAASSRTRNPEINMPEPTKSDVDNLPCVCFIIPTHIMNMLGTRPYL